MSEIVSRIQQAREHLLERRAEIRALHESGSTGAQVVAALTVLVDAVVSKLANAAVDELEVRDAAAFESDIAVVALGGYGRAELAPFSDVDVMFLYQPRRRAVAERLCERLVRDFWDAGLVLGSSMRTPAECVALAKQEISVHTSLLEARHVVGSQWLTDELRGDVGRLTRGRRGNTFVAAALAERRSEQAKCGSNVHLLEPDLKKSKGGLREWHLMRWIAHVRYGVASIDRLEREGHLSAEDAAVLTTARDFLFRVRNDLHFRAGRNQDMLTRSEQVRLAGTFRFADRPGRLAVEQFMQHYYRHSAALDDVVTRFVKRNGGRSVWHRVLRPFTAKRVGGDYVIEGGELRPVPQHLTTVVGSLERMVQLFAVANQYRAPVAYDVCEQIHKVLAPAVARDSAANSAADARFSEEDLSRARAEFLRMLAEPGSLADTLRQLAALGLLDRLIPEFAHARSLIQFNLYHKYTVDEHTLLCIENAEGFRHDSGPLGQVYKEIHHKEVLHLALLLHDLGKGFEQDHSELGRQIALETAKRFSLEPHLGELLVFLVHRHLAMAHLAFRRDTSDEQLLDRFARQVGTPECLKMLFVLTAADIASVGPEMWTTWKAEVLTDLYVRTMGKLSPHLPVMHPEQLIGDVRTRVSQLLEGVVPEEWLEQHLDAMRPSYLLATPPERIAEHLRNIHSLPPNDVHITAVYDAQTAIVTYTVYTFDQITPGLFSKLAGVLAAKGLQILSAQISTFKDGIVVDCFQVLDYDFAGEPPAARLKDVADAITQVLRGERTIDQLFAVATRIGPQQRVQQASIREPTQVRIDNDSSDKFTIIEVFANDRQGLLYVISRTIFELGLSVCVAKIATSLDQVLDVFYVTDLSGHKVTDAVRLADVQRRLAGAIEMFEATMDRMAHAG